MFIVEFKTVRYCGKTYAETERIFVNIDSIQYLNESKQHHNGEPVTIITFKADAGYIYVLGSLDKVLTAIARTGAYVQPSKDV